MHITKTSKSFTNDQFNWSEYFSENRHSYVLTNDDIIEMIPRVRSYLTESPNLMALILTKLLKRLLKNYSIPENPNILELGAGTGTLTRWLITRYGGKGMLVDNNENSYQAYKNTNHELIDDMDIFYTINDIFSFETHNTFDIVGSFGLIEHFKDKTEVLNAHKKFLKKDGIILLLVPCDTFLSRVYWDLHPELNHGYRELLTAEELSEIAAQNNLKKIDVLKSDGYVYDFLAGLFTLAS